MKACHQKRKHLGISIASGRSTLCDASKKRSFEVFAVSMKTYTSAADSFYRTAE